LVGLFVTVLLSSFEERSPPLEIPTWVVVRTNQAFGVVHDLIHSAYDSRFELSSPTLGENQTFLFIRRRECVRDRRAEVTTLRDYACRAKFFANYTLAKVVASLAADVAYTDGHREIVEATEQFLLSYDAGTWEVDYHTTISGSASSR
jgi:hypothetical protein